jgi:invasion protein IalB
MLKPVLTFCLAATLSVSASAQSSSVPSANQTAKTSDPNKIVCQRVDEIGSRLQTKQVCKTAEEWTAEQNDNRDAVAAIQASPPTRPSNDPGPPPHN